MKKLSHTEWAAVPKVERERLEALIGAAFHDAANGVANASLLKHATPALLTAIRRLIESAFVDSARRVREDLPPFWVETRLEDTSLKVDVSVPAWHHDCDECDFLGRFNGHDLYSCSKGPLPTVIARHGDEGGDYKSGKAFVGIDPEITEAARRATT